MEKIEIDDFDFLNIKNDQTITKMIGNEKIYYSDKIKKKQFGFFSTFQERNFFITDCAMYILKTLEMKRRIRIENLYGITYSKQSEQFVIHFDENEYDNLFQTSRRDKIILLLQDLYEKITNKDLLFSPKNERDLSKYVVTKKERRKNPFLFKLDKNDLFPIKEFFKKNIVLLRKWLPFKQ